MSSDVDICNLALAHGGFGASIQSLDEQSQEARYCNVFYSFARQEVLRDHDWSFASKYTALADIGSPPDGWEYRFAYPSDCLMAREVLIYGTGAAIRPETLRPVEFKVSLKTDNSGRSILCNEDTPTLRYTADITNSTLFDSKFVNALSLLMASKLTMPLKQSEKRAQAIYQLYAAALDGAKATDAAEQRANVEHEPDWIANR